MSIAANENAAHTILLGDCRETLKTIAAKSINTCVTSPPYFGLRDYGATGQIGLEDSIQEYIDNIVQVFREVKHCLRDDGTLWLNLGDSYAAAGKTTSSSLLIKPKDLIGIPWRVAFALQADGWYLRQDIIWHKPNPMPESVTDRCTKAHEYLFLLSKSPKYYFDHEAIKEPAVTAPVKRDKMGEGYQADYPKGDRFSSGERVWGSTTRNKRSVWTVATKPYKCAHNAVFPPNLIEPCILAGCPVGGTVLDPFGGSGTTAGVALKHGRNAVLCELNPSYAELVEARITNIRGAA
jgi:DNA modification methylase